MDFKHQTIDKYSPTLITSQDMYLNRICLLKSATLTTYAHLHSLLRYWQRHLFQVEMKENLKSSQISYNQFVITRSTTQKEVQGTVIEVKKILPTDLLEEQEEQRDQNTDHQDYKI